jgi:hypothetical protein
VQGRKEQERAAKEAVKQATWTDVAPFEFMYVLYGINGFVR